MGPAVRILEVAVLSLSVGVLALRVCSAPDWRGMTDSQEASPPSSSKRNSTQSHKSKTSVQDKPWPCHEFSPENARHSRPSSSGTGDVVFQVV